MMRSLYWILPASVMALASHAGAQTESYLSTQSGTTSRVQVIGPAQPFVFHDGQAEWISGAYAMSNGWRLKVDPSAAGIVARIDTRPPALLVDPADGVGPGANIKGHAIRLAAVSPDRYVSPDGNIAMEFNRGRQGDQMLMSYVPDTRTAQVVVVEATLAQR